MKPPGCIKITPEDIRDGKLHARLTVRWWHPATWRWLWYVLRDQPIGARLYVIVRLAARR